MSDNSRLIPLVEAFLTYLKGDETPAQTEAPPKPVATKVAAKPTKPKPELKPEPKSEPEIADEGPSAEVIGGLVEQLLSANKRKEAVALMLKIGGKDAKSVSSLMASGGDLNKFVEEAEALLMAA